MRITIRERPYSGEGDAGDAFERAQRIRKEVDAFCLSAPWEMVLVSVDDGDTECVYVFEDADTARGC